MGLPPLLVAIESLSLQAAKADRAFLTFKLKNRTDGAIEATLDAIIFYSLIALIALVAVPYGTVQLWWKASFQCSVFALAALSVVQKLIARQPLSLRSVARHQIVWPRAIKYPSIGGHEDHERHHQKE